MKNSVEALEKSCSGCGACTAVCPANAITICKDANGFFTASIAQERCLNCGICQQVCMRKDYLCSTDIRTGRLYAMQSRQAETIKACTSGGVAFELAKSAFALGKTVVGTAYNFHTNQAEMIVAKTNDDLEKFKGSKYLQSYSGDCIRLVFDLAAQQPEREFVVFGTPCQIYAFHQVAMRKNMRERFLLVDLFCHGVPSYLVWECYLEAIKKQTGVSNWSYIRFRDSRLGWHNFVLTLEQENCSIHESSERCQFYHAFFDNVLLCEACFDCRPRCNGSGSDLRLGDFWGSRYQAQEDGVSAVLCLTARGENAIRGLSSLEILEETAVEECLSSQSVSPYPEKCLHNQAMRTLAETRSLKKTIQQYRKHFPPKRRLVLFLKEATGLLPAKARNAMKRFYRRHA